MTLWFLLGIDLLPVSAATLTAGSAKNEISPSTEILNWVGHEPYPGVLDPVFVRATVVSDGSTKIALVSWDLTDTREGFVARVRKEVEKTVGIRPDHILINASHTHSAPWVPTEGDPLVAAEQKTLLPVQEGKGFSAWADQLVLKTADAVRKADASRQPVELQIARAWAADLLFNRRPVRDDGMVETTYTPDNPYALPKGQRFGPADPTLTLLAFRAIDRPTNISTLFHLPCHPVSVYPFDKRVSADWPGPVAARLGSAWGGQAAFLQGCAGDIVPIRRNLPARDAMSEKIGDRALAAWTNRQSLASAPIQVLRLPVTLPFTDIARKETGKATVESEVQLIVMGTLALVALPGEPLTGLNQEIQRRSPFPHTLVLGYSNGGGVQYVGPSGDKRKGGYEMSVAGTGADRCGQMLVERALTGLNQLRTEQALAQASKNNTDVYLLIGQSNMAGRGLIEAQDQVPHPRVFVHSLQKGWQLALDPLHHDKVNAGVGLGSWFGKSMADAHAKSFIVLVPAAVGGTPLARWMKGGDLYRQAVEQAKAAMKQGTLKGILWHQGENDADTSEHARSYADRLKQMVADLRSELGAGEVPFIAGQLGPFLISNPPPETPFASIINEQLESLKTQIPHFSVVSAEQLTSMPDNIHFDTLSLREFGTRYAEAMRALQK